MRQQHSMRQLLPLVAIVLLGFALRVNCLHCQSLWLDESESVYWTSITPITMLIDIADSLHTPGYYVLLRLWTKLSGTSEFSVRFFSTWSGLFLIPLFYRFAAQTWRDRRTGFLAAFLAAVSPLHVTYSQETRMYAILPVIYLLLLGLISKRDALEQRWTWLALILVECIALYLHPSGAFMIVALNIALLALILAKEGSRPWLNWLTSQLVVVLVFMPWLWLFWRSGGTIPANLVDMTADETTVSLSKYLHQLWTFLQSGSPETTVATSTTALALIPFVAMALPFALKEETKPKLLLVQLIAFLLPLLTGYALWRINPLSHPRYIIFILAPLLLLLGRALSLLAARHATVWLAFLGLGLLLVNDAVAFQQISGDPRFARFDMRQLADTIGERAESGAAVLMPPFDRALWYYDPAPGTTVNWPYAQGDQEVRASEMQHLEAYSTAFLVEYQTLYSYDPHGQLPFLLEYNGHLVDRFVVDRMNVDHYALRNKWKMPQFIDRELPCGPLTLTGILYETTASPGRATVAAFRWRLDEKVDTRIVISARLWDEQQQLAGDDALLLDELNVATNDWQPGTEAHSYHVLPVPLGTVPLTYTLGAVPYYEGGGALCESDVFQGLRLEAVHGLENREQASDPYGSWRDTEWQAPLNREIAPGLSLEGYALRPAPLRPHDTVYITLRWRAKTNLSESYEPVLLLHQGNVELAHVEGDLFSRYPTEEWGEGELLIETRQFLVPAELSPMTLTLVAGHKQVPIGTLSINRDALLWDVPQQATPICARLGNVAELIGYEWQLAEAQDSGSLVLFWRALPNSTSAPSYTVFTHLLDESNQLVGQHDGLPANGQRPTTSWLPGEVIADVHELAASEDAEGVLHLTAGMYDLNTGERLPVYHCDGQRYGSNAVPLFTLDASTLK